MENIILSKIDSIADEMINSIIDLVKIPSIKGKEEDLAPYGIEIKKALNKALEISDKLGFITKNIDNHIGYAQYEEGDNYVCAIGHLDVVEVGEGWKNPPFSGYKENGYIYGRGVLDNKGPILSCLYGLYALKELNIKVKYPIRIIFGCDEETGRFNDLNYYLQKEKPPLMGFTPDCKYPVVYSERGRAILTIIGSYDYIEEFYKVINSFFLNSKNKGEKLGIDYENNEYGLLELRNYNINNNEGNPNFSVTISYPFGTNCNEIKEKLERSLNKYKNIQFKLENKFLPVKFSKDDFLVQSLQKAYEKITGLDGTPVTTSGGTYAKMMPNIVPFGPSFPGQKNISHNPNEWMKIDEIILNAKIYALSFYNMVGK